LKPIGVWCPQLQLAWLWYDGCLPKNKKARTLIALLNAVVDIASV
jgi:hypothetical protein